MTLILIQQIKWSTKFFILFLVINDKIPSFLKILLMGKDQTGGSHCWNMDILYHTHVVVVDDEIGRHHGSQNILKCNFLLYSQLIFLVFTGIALKSSMPWWTWSQKQKMMIKLIFFEAERQGDEMPIYHKKRRIQKKHNMIHKTVNPTSLYTKSYILYLTFIHTSHHHHTRVHRVVSRHHNVMSLSSITVIDSVYIL